MANLPGRTKKPPVEIVPEGPSFPDELSYLWSWFVDLSRGLPQTGMGPAVVTWESIRAWQVLMDIGPLEPWEVETLVRLGRLRAVIESEKAEAERQVQRTKR